MNNRELVNRMLLCDFDKDFVYSLDNKRWYTYGQIWGNAISFMEFFRSKNATEVSVVLENGITLFTCYFACMLGNIKIVPIDPQKSETEIGHIQENHPGILKIGKEDELPALTDETAEWLRKVVAR